MWMTKATIWSVGLLHLLTKFPGLFKKAPGAQYRGLCGLFFWGSMSVGQRSCIKSIGPTEFLVAYHCL